jgi:putative endonuclease
MAEKREVKKSARGDCAGLFFRAHTVDSQSLLVTRQVRNYYVYIMSNRTHTLYIGVTDNLYRRVEEHRAGTLGGFTSKYKVRRLVYFEHTDDVGAAIAREKQLKNWRRAKKIRLIEAMNPTWTDLSRELFGEIES